MKISRCKTAGTATSLILLIAMAVSIVGLPSADAQASRHTVAVIGAVPNPVGVGQETLLWVGITDPLPNVNLGWEGLTVTVTKPDGKTETLGPFKTDATGSTGTIYVPTTVGTYYLQTNFPEQVLDMSERGVPAGTVYLASTSEKLELTVTEEPVTYWPGIPLPTEYWTRPIDAEFREWNPIAGNWLGNVLNKFARYDDDAPETGHILWAKPLAMGGLAGGLDFGPQAYECGDAYEGLFANSVIIGGVVYYNQFKSSGGTNVEQEVVAVDLHTGEVLWQKPLLDPDGVSRRLSFGQVFYWDSYNYHAAFDYLWATAGSTWFAFDAFSGRWEYTMEGVPSGTNIYGSKGEIYRYTVNLENGWMTLWNSSRVGSTQGSWGSQVTGRTLNATRGMEWNVTIPAGMPGDVGRLAYFEDRIIGTNTAWMAFTAYPIVMWGISTAPGREGQLLFNKTWVPTQADLSINMAAASVEDGVFVMVAKETRTFFGFDIDSGSLLWGPSEPKPILDYFDITASGYDLYVHASQCIAYGKLFSGGTGGVAAAYDVETGELLWNYTVVDEYTEILWGNNWPLRPAFIADGKIYLSHQEHSPIDPKPRGAPFICLNTTTGDLIWKMILRGNWWGGPPIIGDSILTTMNSYDQRVYAVGKGPSATTVTAPGVGIQLGSSVLLTGMVTDVAPGTNDAGLTMRFPNGVPAVSDANMSEWMQYAYMQFPRPTDIVGVNVVVSVIDPNHNSYEVGRTTSDASGMYKLAFTPEVPGEYTVIASFAGSKAYYGSYAQTAINVEEAPAATPEPTPTPASIADLYLVPGIVGIIVAIAVVGAILMLMLRKR